MTPDFEAVLRRRHLVTIAARFLIAAYGGWCAYKLAVGPVWGACQLIFNWSNNSGVIGQLLGRELLGDVYVLLQCALVLVFVMLEPRLVRWIVPMPPAEHACPKCGYSLKNLKSPCARSAA